VTNQPTPVATSDLLLPPTAVLLHIGPYKTGSTAIQSAMFARRDELPQYGVAYPGNWRRIFGIGHSVLRWAPRGHKLPDIERWERFAAGVREMSDRRVCVSTEDFGRIQKLDRSRKIVEDLGADRLHVVAVARAYHRLLPSHWQERVKSHFVTEYDDWLEQVLGDDEEAEAHRSFRTSHDVAWMLSRWLPYVPPERFTVIVTDDSDRRLLPRTFEQMLGLPEEFLTLDDNSNASLSYQATEMLRHVNEVFEDRGWSDVVYTHYLQRGLVPALQSGGRSPLESSIPRLPAWALDAVRHKSQERIRAIEEAGINVVGDVSTLLPPDDAAAPAEVAPVESISVSSAVTAVAGVLDAALRREEELEAKLARAKKSAPARRRREKAPPPRGPRVADTPSRALLKEIVHRQRGRLTRRRTVDDRG
jgi:hypothetical protein